MAKGKSENKDKNSFPSVLSVKRSVNLTDALMRSCSSKELTVDNVVEFFDKAKPIEASGHGQRVTSAYKSDKQQGNSEKGNDSRNLCYGEMAMLPSDDDTLLIRFAGTFLPIADRLDQCDKPEWSKFLENAYPLLIERAGMHIASCYAYHLCSGIWLWRNREDVESISVVVEYGDNNENRIAVKNALDIPMHAVKPAGHENYKNYELYEEDIVGFNEFAKEVYKAFAGKIRNKIELPTGLHFRVTASCKMKRRQLIHPSQLFLPVKEKEGNIEIGRVYYKIDGQVGMTFAKLGNALRRFDRSHGYEKFETDILPTEPTGGSLNRSINMRGEGEKNSFYDYMVSHIATGKVNELDEEEIAYILGVLIRGGVFVEKGNKNKGQKPDTEQSGESGE